MPGFSKDASWGSIAQETDLMLKGRDLSFAYKGCPHRNSGC